MTKLFDSSCCPVSLGSRLLNSLLYADDLLFLSESAEGLRNCMNKVYNYCLNWGLAINHNKSKVMIFDKSGRMISRKFYINDKSIESVYQYTYLGVLFSLNGSFKRALVDLNARG